jgi:hypothetical protein
MRRLLILLIGLFVFSGCATHTEFGGNRFGATFQWGDDGYADPYSYQGSVPPAY